VTREPVVIVCHYPPYNGCNDTQSFGTCRFGREYARRGGGREGASAHSAIGPAERHWLMDRPWIRHFPPILLAPIAGECATLRLQYSHMARGTAVKEYAWSYWLRWSPRAGSGSRSGWRKNMSTWQ
jgi:hypothetical protein